MEQKEGKKRPSGAAKTKAWIQKHFREGIYPEGLSGKRPSARLFDQVRSTQTVTSAAQHRLPSLTFNVTDKKKKMKASELWTDVKKK